MKMYGLAAALLAIVVATQFDARPPRPVNGAKPQGVTVHVPCATSGSACGDKLQAAIQAAAPGTTITLDAGKIYEASLVVQPRAATPDQRPLLITTRGWTDKGPGWNGLVTPADKPRMAVLRGAPRSSAALAVMDGEGAGFLSVVGVAFEATAPDGRGELIRIGSGDAHRVGQVPHQVAVRQVLLQGSRDFGQKRGIAANGVDIEVSQVWCEEIFTPGQDSQCVGAWNAGQRVRINHSYLAAGSENIIVGGATIPTAEMQPADWLIEDVILHKPLRWQQDGRNRQVKNLLEFKHGRNLTARRVLAVNNWRAAQDGRGLLISYATNGRCPACGHLEQVVIEDFVMLNVAGGVSLVGYSWQPDSFSKGKLRDLTLRNLYVQISGDERAIQLTNVLGAHDWTIERSTFINNGPNWIVGSFGRAWRDEATIVDGGAMEGLRIVNNVIAANGEYGITAPDGRHFGTGIADFANARLEIAGNVIGDAPRDHLGRYNQHRQSGPPNVAASRDALLKALPATSCGEWAPGRGADCSRLNDIFGWLNLLPER